MSNWDLLTDFSKSTPLFIKSPVFRSGFEKLLLEAVEETFSSFGDLTKETVYSHLRKTFNIEKQSIPDKIDEFSRALEEILGIGALLLEIEIMKRLYQKIGHTLKYSPKKDSLTFTGYVKAVKYASTLASATPPNKEQASDRTG